MNLISGSIQTSNRDDLSVTLPNGLQIDSFDLITNNHVDSGSNGDGTSIFHSILGPVDPLAINSVADNGTYTTSLPAPSAPQAYTPSKQSTPA